MKKALEVQGLSVTRFIEVDPDKLIELGHRIKSIAMDHAYPGQTVLALFTDEITFIYNPAKEFCKPLHRVGDQAPKLDHVVT